MLNWFKQTSYSSSKYINSFGVKIIKIIEEIKELDITIEEMIAIKLINDLSSLFETFLTILNQKARDNNKLLDL